MAPAGVSMRGLTPRPTAVLRSGDGDVIPLISRLGDGIEGGTGAQWNHQPEPSRLPKKGQKDEHACVVVIVAVAAFAGFADGHSLSHTTP
jgi:hypothetical protein